MSEAVIDSVVFDEIADLMGESMPEFIETYLENTPKLLEEMSLALSAGEFVKVAQNAHQLKGGSGSIGAMQVFSYAKQLEAAGNEGRADNVKSLFVELKEAYTKVEAELKTRL